MRADTYQQVFLYVLLILSLFPISQSMAQYELKKESEFRIHSLYPVEIIDHYPQDGVYLGYINTFSEGMEVAVISEEGEILISKNLHGEGPNEYTTALNCLGFSEEGDIWALTTHQLLHYDRALKIKERVRFKTSTQIYLSGRVEPFTYFDRNGSQSDFSFVAVPSGTSKYLGNSDFKNTHLIEIFSSKENDIYEIAPVAERPLYEALDKSIYAIYFPIYRLDSKDSKFYLTTSLDNEITVYDLNTNIVVSRIKINHGEFKSLKSSPISLKSLPSYDNIITLAAFNHKIFKLDEELLALEYIREIPYGTYEKKIAEDPEYHHFRDPTYHRLILFDQKKQLTGDLSIPYGKTQMALPGNRLLVRLINPDEEEDFIRYGIYKVTKTGK